MFSMMKCEGWSMSIDIQVGCDNTLGGGGGGGDGGGGRLAGSRVSGNGSFSGSPSRCGLRRDEAIINEAHCMGYIIVNGIHAIDQQHRCGLRHSLQARIAAAFRWQ